MNIINVCDFISTATNEELQAIHRAIIQATTKPMASGRSLVSGDSFKPGQRVRASNGRKTIYGVIDRIKLKKAIVVCEVTNTRFNVPFTLLQAA